VKQKPSSSTPAGWPSLLPSLVRRESAPETMSTSHLYLFHAFSPVQHQQDDSLLSGIDTSRCREIDGDGRRSPRLRPTSPDMVAVSRMRPSHGVPGTRAGRDHSSDAPAPLRFLES